MTIKAVKIKIYPEDWKSIHYQSQEYNIIDNQETKIGNTEYANPIYPGDDYSAAPQEVQIIAAKLHTNELITAYQNKDNPTLEQAKASRIALLAQERYQVETSGVNYDTHIIRTDRDSVQILDTYINKLRDGRIVSIDWKCVDSWLTIDSSNADEIESLVMTHIATVFAKEKQAQVDIAALTDIESIQNYSITW